MTNPTHEYEADLHEARWELLTHINTLTDKLMTALAFVWLGLLIIDFIQGLTPLLQAISNIIWILFIVDFVIEFIIAPHKRQYLRRNWLTALSLLLPALRVLRIFRAFRLLGASRTLRTVSFVRLVTSLNRGMRATAKTLGRRNVGFVVAFTIVVTFAGAAAMLLFESPQSLYESGVTDQIDPDAGFRNYGDAVWWTAMLMTTLGSEYWPQTAEGRILCWMLSIYALVVFGYITAALASYFIGVDRDRQEAPPPPIPSDLSLQAQLSAVQSQMQILLIQLEQRPSHPDAI